MLHILQKEGGGGNRKINYIGWSINTVNSIPDIIITFHLQPRRSYRAFVKTVVK